MKRAYVLAGLVCAILVGSFLPIRTKLLLGMARRNVMVTLPGMAFHVNVHRAVHMAAFGVAGWLLFRISRRRRVLVMMAVVACAVALAIEAGEVAAFHNAMEWTDVGDDLMGITIALMLSVLRR